MAIYFLNLKTFGRSGGSSAVSAAAYRAGERIRDERAGKTYDHSDRQDVMHKEIILPAEFAADDMYWAKDRSNLWNTAEDAETRKNARVAREYLVALPAELAHENRLHLVRSFSQELVERYRFALDVAIHAPRGFPGSDPRNFHAHLLATTREVTTQGLGPKTTVEWNDSHRREAGMGPAVNELLHVRQRWAEAANEALHTAHLSERIDHRSLAAQGIEREPGPHIPRAAFEMERHGYRSVVAERIREEYQARVESRSQRAAQTQRAPQMQPAAQPKLSAEELQGRSVENWLRYRRAHSPSDSQSQSKDPAGSRSRDDDHSL
jgi:ATP-dependent exoDNAse (exonuclease V) alpha subunit